MPKNQLSKQNNKPIAHCGICAKELCYGDSAFAFLEGTVVNENYDGWKDFGKEFAPLIDMICQKCWDKVLKKINTLNKITPEEKHKLKVQARENGFLFRARRIE